jgi:hypothetical protein
MKISELIVGTVEPEGKKFDLLSGFYIWTTKEEDKLLEKLKDPIKLGHLSEHDQFRVQALIRKSLVTKVGQDNPTVVANKYSTK